MFTLSLLDAKDINPREVRVAHSANSADELAEWIGGATYPGFTEGRRQAALRGLVALAQSHGLTTIDGGGWAIRRY